MLHMDLSFFSVGIICGFTSTFVAICYANSQPFRFLSRKNPLLDILKLLVTTLINKDKKITLIQLDGYGSLAIYSEFMRTCYNMNIIVKNTGGYLSLLNGKREIPNTNEIK